MRSTVMKEEELVLRPITEKDTDLILRWRNSDAVMENFIIRTPLTRQQHENWLATKVATGEVEQFIMEAGMPIGSVYLRNVDIQNKTAEYGIFIGEESGRGKGYGTKALSLMKKFAYEELGLESLYLEVIETNIKAYAMYEKAGFCVDETRTRVFAPNGQDIKIFTMVHKR